MKSVNDIYISSVDYHSTSAQNKAQLQKDGQTYAMILSESVYLRKWKTNWRIFYWRKLSSSFYVICDSFYFLTSFLSNPFRAILSISFDTEIWKIYFVTPKSFFYTPSSLHANLYILSRFLFLDFKTWWFKNFVFFSHRSVSWSRQVLSWSFEIPHSLNFPVQMFCLKNFKRTYFVIATAISYTGSRRSRNKYFPISVRAAAESIASRPTRFRSKYGVASLPWLF